MRERVATLRVTVGARLYHMLLMCLLWAVPRADEIESMVEALDGPEE